MKKTFLWKIIQNTHKFVNIPHKICMTMAMTNFSMQFVKTGFQTRKKEI